MIALLWLAPAEQQPGWVYAVVLGGIALAGVLLYCLDRRDKKKNGGRRGGVATRAGGAFLEVQSLLEPGKRHVIVARETKRAEEDGERGPDDTSQPNE